MTNVATFLLFILLPATVLAQTTVDENDMVQCFNDQSSCTANSNGMMITAGQCCNSAGGSTRRVRVGLFCASCFTVTFSERSYLFGPANKGETVSFPVTVSYFSGTGSYTVRLQVNSNPDPIPGSSPFIASLSQNILQYTPTTTSQNWTMTLANEGNQIALDDDLMFTLEMSLSGTPIFSSGFAIIVLSSASVTIGDLDVVTIRFERSSYEAQESSQSLSVVVSRGTISFSNAFNVTVTTREYSGDPSTLTDDQSLATPNVDYRDGESMTKTFEAYTADTERTFQFYIKDDTTVELDEVFDVFITVNDSRVNIERDVSSALISDDEKFSIGFRETMHTIREGEDVTLIVDEYQGFVGGISVSGVPVERLTGSFLRFSTVESKAVENVDFAINGSLPRFTYSLNNTINSIFVPFQSLTDTVLETSEKAVLEIRLVRTDLFIQIHNNIVQRVTVTILDNTLATVRLSASKYNVSESVGIFPGMMVCADLINATLGSGQNLQVNFNLSDGSALKNQDYFQSIFDPKFFTFFGPATQACITIRITNDNIREPLLEFFNITLLPYDPVSSPTPGFTGLTVDTTPSSICIEDDDQAEVRFERSNVTFSEAHGDQNIYVILGVGRISNNQTVEVYDIRTNKTLGIVTFVGGVQPPQRQPVVFPVVNNDIALEFDILTRLGLRNYGQLQEGTPFTMNVTVVDDDAVTINFDQALYPYSESHGVVSDITVVLSNEIAQDLTVTISGGPGSQPSTVNISGFNVNEVITFVARGSISQGLSNFTIINDAVALETIELYNLSFSNPSITNRVTLGPDTRIQITDDDVVTINFGRSMYPYSENHGIVSDITVVLSNEIAQSLTVTISGGPGSQPSTVNISGINVNEVITFAARGSQSKGLSNFTITNDAVALETIEQYDLSFSNPSITNRVTLGPDTRIQITDDDVVTVNFVQNLYSYREDHGLVSDIIITLSTVIAQSLTVTVSGGPGSQPSTVQISGVDVNEVITFAARGDQSQGLPSFTIKNDSFALETIERYDLSFSNPSITNNVILGSDTTIQITDDDVVTINFGKNLYPYSENHGIVSDITITLSTEIAQNLSVTVSGGPGSQPSTVNISGVDVNEVITFAARGDQSQGLPSFTIVNDAVALETIEQYDLSFSNPSITNNVTLGPDTRIQIADDDVVTVNFVQNLYSYREDHGLVSDMALILSTEIAQDLTVTASGGPGNQPSTVEISGIDATVNITFVAHGPQFERLPSLSFINDTVALETVEQYNCSLSNPSITNGVILGPDAIIQIFDDDVVTVNFGKNLYPYIENHGVVSDITITLSNAIAQSLTVTVSGGPGSQPSTVQISGVDVNEVITFAARGDQSQGLPSFTIKNDSFALETIEQYDLSFSNPSITNNVILGSDTTIQITDDDVVTINFGKSLYPYNENHGVVSDITITLSTEIAQNLSVTVSGGPGSQPSTVEISGVNVNEVITFAARGSQSQGLPSFTIKNDSFALETIERYDLSFSNPSITNNVILGSDTTIQITDDEVLQVDLDPPMSFYDEGQPANLRVTLSYVIVQDFSVDVNGSSGSQLRVSNSGPPINERVMYVARGARTVQIPFTIGNDDVAREDMESYQVALSNPSDTSAVLGTAATINIRDTDYANITFEQSQYVFLENAGLTMDVTVILSTRIAEGFTARVVGDPGVPPPTIVNSGSVVNYDITFLPFNNSIANLEKIIPVQIVNDSTSGEPDQMYDLTFVGVPTGTGTKAVNEYPYERTTIVIIDDDVARVFFDSPETRTLESDQGEYITVVLTGSISHNVSVDVVDDNGNVVRTVIFQPMAGISRQTMRFFVPYPDDIIALEPDEYFNYYLMNPVDVIISSPNTTRHRLVDDDVLLVTFVKSAYNFNENDQSVFIEAEISNPIARTFTVSTTFLRQQIQPFVSISGPLFTDTLIYQPNRTRTLRVSEFVRNDDIALEDVETYFVRFINPDPSPSVNPYVRIGNDTLISVFDDDTVNVTFSPGNHFVEAQTTDQIAVRINAPIIRDLQVNIRSTPQPDPLLEQSGSSYTTSVTFPSQGNTIQLFTFPIKDDTVAFENVENVELSFINSSYTKGVILGSNEIATITDPDGVTVMFVDSVKNDFENETSVTVQLMTSNIIKRNVSVRVRGGPNRSQQFVEFSGTDVDQYVTFVADGSNKASFTFALNDDMKALEVTETYQLYLNGSMPSQNVNLGGPMTVNIFDDDYLNVMFGQSEYVFYENVSMGSVMVKIDKEILQDFTIQVTGGPGTQPMTVVISGSNVSSTAAFTAGGSLMTTVTFIISDDSVSLEDDEEYFLNLQNPNPSTRVIVGDKTKIIIKDDDPVIVTFSPGNHFYEAQTTEQIAVRINTPIIRDLQVNIRSTPQPDPLVEQSGSSYTTSVTFPSQGNTTQLFTFPIKDDTVAFENVENVELSFINSSYTNGVILGSNEIATITDPDGVTVMFVDSVINVFENETSVTVQLTIDYDIKRNVSVRVRGGPNRSQQFVEFSGTDVDQYVTFVADGSNKSSFTFSLNDDMKALEVTETYQLYLNGSMPSQNVNLGGPMTVNIFDDDYLNVMFGQSEYVFYENVSMGSVMVKIDKEILQDFTIQVTGGPGTQPMTVVISGSDVSSTAAFTAGGSLMTTVTFNISDDSVSLEDDEEYFLYLQNPNPSTRVIVGDRTKIIIKDDDPLVYGFVDSFRTFIENRGNGTFNFVVSRTAKPTSYNMTMKRILPSNIVRSLLDLDCGQDASGILNVPASTASDAVVTCTAVIQDDIIALEDDETVTITATLVTPNPSTIMVTPGRSTLPVTVQDDDNPIVTMVDSTKDVTEGDMVEICIQVNKMSVRNIIVRLRTDDGTATTGFDYTGGEKTLIIPPGSQGPICVNYTTLPDTLNEGDENFNVRIISVSSTTPNSADPTQPMMGSPDTTNVIIKDVAPPTRTCTVDGITGRLSTFNNLDNYIYNRSCEHILVIQQTTYGEFAIVIDTLDGTYRTARLGVRLGNETLVISAANLTVLKSVNLRLIVVNAGTNSIEITIAQFGLRIRVTNESITIDIETGFLNFHLGLCGNVMGNLVFRNSTVVNTSDPKALNKAINQYLVPPSETIARTVTRRHCGLLVEDVETGDPMYAVPLYTPDQSKPHTYSICYEVHGEANRYFNFISDECTSVNAHYFGTADPDPDSTRDFHGVDGVYVLAVNNDKQCVNITVSLDQINDCDTTLNGGTISSYKHRGISVQVAGNTTNITVPNCVDGALTMQVICKATANGVKFQEFRVIRGLNLNEESHGIIGQFWNVKSVVTKYDTPLRDGTVSPQAYKIELQPKNKPTRTFIGFLEDVTWDFTPQQCLYVGNAQAGPINEAADGEPNDSLIEGDYTQYIMDSSYDVGFTYQHFNSQC